MPTPAQEEADQASLAYHLALTQIGVETVEEALALWRDVPPNARLDTASRWLTRAVSLVSRRRRQSRDLAMAYYRLVRALHTGSTIEDPLTPRRPVTLDTLREEFTALADPETAASRPPSPAPQEGDRGERDEDDGLDQEVIEGLLREERRLAQEALREAELVLGALGPVNQARLIEQDTDPDEANVRAGARQAAAAARVAMDGARSSSWEYMKRDRRAIGYVRVSRTGTPCGFCAMLISRGEVFYASEESASYKGVADGDSGDLYHDNCNCTAIPVFTREQYRNSSQFALNREYSELWPQVTRGLQGKAALSAWRRFIREQNKTRSQEERPTDTSRRRENQ